MPIPRPRLDDRSYAELREEALRVATTGTSGWTDLNPSDPGVTILEVLAWIAESLVYRCDQVTPEDVLTFLRLLNGPSWPFQLDRGASPDAQVAALREEVRHTRLMLNTEDRAVTPADYVRLARHVPSVVEAVCVPRRHVEAGPDVDRPGHVTVVVVPARGADRARVIESVAASLASRRLIGTHVHVTTPVPVPVAVALLARSRRDVRKGGLRAALMEAICARLDDHPPGEPVHVSAVRAELEAEAGVEVVSALELRSPIATPDYHDSGELVSLTVRPHQQVVLGRRDGKPDVRVALGRSLVQVNVTAHIRVVSSLPRSAITREVNGAVRAWFPPDDGDLDLDNTRWRSDDARPLGELADAARDAVRRLVPDGTEVQARVNVGTSPLRTAGEPGQEVISFERDELPHVRCQVEVQEP
jgi:hypothetical protein